MTAPTPPTPPTGQPTLQAILDFIAQLAAAAKAALQDAIHLLDPSAGKEVEREKELADMFAAKDIQGLLAYDATVPAHPNKSRIICRNYLKMLGYDTSTLPPLP